MGDDVQKKGGSKEARRGRVTGAYAFAMSLLNTSPTTSLFMNVPLIMSAAGTSAPYAIMITMFLCLSLSRTLQQFVRFRPACGSFHTYSSLSLGPWAGLFTAWVMLFAYVALGMQGILGIGGWMSDAVADNFGVRIPWMTICCFAIILITWLSVIGIDESLRVSLILSCAEAAIVITFCVFLMAKGSHFVPNPSDKQQNPNGGFGILQAIIYAVLVCDGFEGATALADEAADPARVISISVIGSVLCVSGFVLFGSVAFVWAEGPEQSSHMFDSGMSSVTTLAREYVSTWFCWLVSIAGLSASFNYAVAQLNFNARVLYSMGRSRMFGLHWFGSVSSRWHTPVKAIIVGNGFMFVACLLVSVVYAVELSSDPWSGTEGTWAAYAMANFVGSCALLVVYVMPNFGLAIYVRKYHPDSFSRWDHQIRPILTSIATFGAIAGMMYPLPSTVGFVLISLFILWLIVGAWVAWRVVAKLGVDRAIAMILDESEPHSHSINSTTELEYQSLLTK